MRRGTTPPTTSAWTAPAGQWELWIYRAVRKDGTLNPLMVGSGDTVIRGFFQQFQDHTPEKSAKGLNYFFNDELHIGLGKFAWNPDFAGEFLKRKGYAILARHFRAPGGEVDLVVTDERLVRVA